MAILVDPPRWPAHGTFWAHLVSDRSLAELHAFARANDVPERAFDLDHYDVPAERVDDLVAAGAERVPGRELLSRLRESGLRVPGVDRHGEAGRRLRTELADRWTTARPDGSADWSALGEELLERWAEPHRRYHDLAHLSDVLRNLDELATAEEAVPRAVVLAAWFHDVVYDGRPGRDEEASAALAEDRLTAVGTNAVEVFEVTRLVRLTGGHSPAPDDRAGAVLCDADLAILAASPRRYGRYVDAVRAEYAHVDDADFRRGRAAVLQRLLGREHLFTTTGGRARWEARARENMTTELAALREEGTPAFREEGTPG